MEGRGTLGLLARGKIFTASEEMRNAKGVHYVYQVLALISHHMEHKIKFIFKKRMISFAASLVGHKTCHVMQ